MHRPVGLIALSFTILAGCASSTEVRGADETESGSSSEAETTPAPATSATAPVTDACDAGDRRQCSQRYSDAHGTAHCLIATQFCSPAGKAWLACGAAPVADAGTY